MVFRCTAFLICPSGFVIEDALAPIGLGSASRVRIILLNYSSQVVAYDRLPTIDSSSRSGAA